jgi:GcrA cell cycle regulator
MGDEMVYMFSWTPEAIETLRTMALAGKTYGEVARELNAKFGPISRSAVCGKAHRLGLPARTDRAANHLASDKRKPAPKPATITIFQGPSGQRTALEVAAPVEVQIDGGVTIMDLRETTCRWPLWGYNETPTEARFCGTEISPERTYCADHRKLAYTPRPVRTPATEATRMAQRIAQLRRWAKEKGPVA